MKILVNTVITNDRLNVVDRARPIPHDRIDIFKYTIASWSILQPIVNQTIMYIGLDEPFKDRMSEIKDWISEVYQSPPTIHWYKNKTQKQYQETYDELFSDGEELVLYNGNDDHIFWDYSLDVMLSAIQYLTEDTNPEAVLYYSVFPEMCRISHHHNAQLTSDGNFVIFDRANYDSIQMMKKERWHRYWFSTDMSHIDNIRRSDDLSSEIAHPPTKIYAPTREVFRHFDGYSHLLRDPSTGENFFNTIPELEIPDGFFESKIKIRYGYSDRREGWVNINPSSKNLYAYDNNAADYRWVLSDIPLFWRKRISEVDVNMELTEEDHRRMFKDRDQFFLETTRIPMRSYSIHFDETNEPPEHWYYKQLKGI